MNDGTTHPMMHNGWDFNRLSANARDALVRTCYSPGQLRVMLYYERRNPQRWPRDVAAATIDEIVADLERPADPPPPPPPENCGTCRFFVRGPDSCHRYPPPAAAWPQVFETCWCGEWKPKPAGARP